MRRALFFQEGSRWKRRIFLALSFAFTLRLHGAFAADFPNEIAAVTSSHDQIAPLHERKPAPPLPSNLKASALIGATVRDVGGERLGAVQDIVINLDSRTVPIAIIERGGAFAFRGTKIAVPLVDLTWLPDRNQFTLDATKQQFDAASSKPIAGWLVLAGESWANNVDAYYGDPRLPQSAQLSPDQSSSPNSMPHSELKAANGQPEQPLADPEHKHQVSTPPDEYIMAKINGIIRQDIGTDSARNVRVTLKEGLVTLAGRVPSTAHKKLLENQIKAIGGVDRVQNNLGVSITNY
jgi:hypothetical protein